MAVVGTVAATNVIERMHQGYRDTARTQIGVFKGALEEYARFCNRYPTSDQGLEALVAKPTSGPECNNYPAGGIMKDGKIPKDPWGKDYVYTSEDGKTFLITSYARDGKEGGDKGTSDEDVRSDNL